MDLRHAERPARIGRHRICLALCLAALAALAGNSRASDREPPMKLMDFASADTAPWYVVNDNVMGGRSEGGYAIDSGSLVFAGATNTDGGGFSSIRSASAAYDLSDTAGIRLRVRGDGRTYRFRLETADGVAYFADFSTAEEGRWETVDIPFSGFAPRRRGRPLDGPPLDPARIESLGLMIYDKRDGPFRLEVDWIGTY